jgi:hypothetical protein
MDNRQVSESLKVAFRGEIGAIRSILAVDARTAMKAWEQGGMLKEYKITYPRTIYDAHARNLGDLRESVLVGHISSLYSTLERAQEAGRRIQKGIYGRQGFEDYTRLLVASMGMAVFLDMRLTEQTKHLVEVDWAVRVSEKDEADGNFVAAAMKALGQ